MLDVWWYVLGFSLAGLVVLAIIFARVRAVGLRAGSFECALRTGDSRNWASGIAVFGPDRLDWFRVMSVSPQPARSWRRRRLTVDARAYRLVRGRRTSIMELSCRVDSHAFTLAMSEQAAAGLTSWLEAAPPGGSPSPSSR